MQVKPTKSIIISNDTPINNSQDFSSSKTESDKNSEVVDLKKKENRFYLPVLNINKPDAWESKPLEERRHFTDAIATETCLTNCCGVPGLKSGCCTLDPDDLEHVLGSVDEKWIRDIVKWFRAKNILMTREDIVIDFDEGAIIGKTMFKGHPIFENRASYPMLRVQVLGPRFACKFLNPSSGKCTIYLMRPDMCRNYLCQYIKKNFLVLKPTKTEDSPKTWNTWQKLA